MNFVKKYFVKKDFVLFLVIGAINTVNGIFLSYVYSLFLQANLAFACGYITSLSAAYFLNSFIIFHAKPQFMRYTKFIISYIPNFIIQNVLVLVFYNGLNWSRIIVYMLAAAIGLPITFLFVKLFAFGKKENRYSA